MKSFARTLKATMFPTRASCLRLAILMAVGPLVGANDAVVNATPINSPSALHSAATVIGFESFADDTPVPLIFEGVTIDATVSATRVQPSSALSFTEIPGVLEGNLLGHERTDFFIEFDTPVSQFGMGIGDPNFSGNVLAAYDASNNLLESVSSAPGDPIFPTGPTGGTFSTFVGFVRSSPDIKRIELIHRTGPEDKLSIDTVTFLISEPAGPPFGGPPFEPPGPPFDLPGPPFDLPGVPSIFPVHPSRLPVHQPRCRLSIYCSARQVRPSSRSPNPRHFHLRPLDSSCCSAIPADVATLASARRKRWPT